MNSILTRLNLNKVGFLELTIAFYPILAAYSYGTMYLSHIVLLVLDVVIILKGKLRFLRYRPLLVFLIFLVLHQILAMTFFGLTQSYYLNSFIASIIFIVSLFIIVPAIDFEKLEGSINWVSIMSLIGLYYHVVLAISGQSISPIKLPFLPAPQEPDARLYEIGQRPVSFFIEPQSYVSYMIFTLFFALRNNRYIWVVLVGLSFVLSTSTTGLAMLPVIIILSLKPGNNKWYRNIILAVLMAGLVMFLYRSTLASFGLEKLENTELSANARTSNGPAMVRMMDVSDVFFGVPYANASDFYRNSNSIHKQDVMASNAGNVYIPAFWIAFVFYGIIGLVFYLNLYWGLLKRKRDLLPIMGCIIISLFTNPDFISSLWSFQMMFLLSASFNKDGTLQLQRKNI